LLRQAKCLLRQEKGLLRQAKIVATASKIFSTGSKVFAQAMKTIATGWTPGGPASRESRLARVLDDWRRARRGSMRAGGEGRRFGIFGRFWRVPESRNGGRPDVRARSTTEPGCFPKTPNTPTTTKYPFRVMSVDQDQSSTDRWRNGEK